MKAAKPKVMKVVVIGGGIAGCAAGILLKKLKTADEEVEVEIYEQQDNNCLLEGGRSLNITLCDRGWSVIEKLDCYDILRDKAVRMTHRAVHLPDGTISMFPYEYVKCWLIHAFLCILLDNIHYIYVLRNL